MDACNLAWCNGDVIAFNNLRSNDRVNGLPDAGKLKLKAIRDNPDRFRQTDVADLRRNFVLPNADRHARANFLLKRPPPCCGVLDTLNAHGVGRITGSASMAKPGLYSF